MKRGYNRSDRVASLVQKTLAQLLLEGVGGESFPMVTVTGVTMSKDLSYAKIYVSVLNDDENEIKETVKALNRLTKTIGYQLVQLVKLRIAPELKFVYDETSARAFRLSSLIDSAIKKTEKE